MCKEAAPPSPGRLRGGEMVGDVWYLGARHGAALRAPGRRGRDGVLRNRGYWLGRAAGWRAEWKVCRTCKGRIGGRRVEAIMATVSGGTHGLVMMGEDLIGYTRTKKCTLQFGTNVMASHSVSRQAGNSHAPPPPTRENSWKYMTAMLHFAALYTGLINTWTEKNGNLLS